MSRYTIEYQYDNYEEGCSCCSYSVRSLTVYDKEWGNIVAYSDDNVDLWAEDHHDLKEYVDKELPSYSDFEVHDDTKWF